MSAWWLVPLAFVMGIAGVVYCCCVVGGRADDEIEAFELQALWDDEDVVGSIELDARVAYDQRVADLAWEAEHGNAPQLDG